MVVGSTNDLNPDSLMDVNFTQKKENKVKHNHTAEAIYGCTLFFSCSTSQYLNYLCLLYIGILSSLVEKKQLSMQDDYVFLHFF